MRKLDFSDTAAITRNGAPLHAFYIGDANCDVFDLNTEGKFDGTSDIEVDWNWCVDNCQGDWFAFMRPADNRGEFHSLYIAFALDADADAYMATYAHELDGAAT